jgi:hypothetical protein
MSDWGIMPSSAEEPVQGCFSSQAQQGGPVVVGSGYRQRGRETGPPASAGDDGATGWAGTPCDGRRSLHSPHPPRLVSLSAVCACTHGLAPYTLRPKIFAPFDFYRARLTIRLIQKIYANVKTIMIYLKYI